MSLTSFIKLPDVAARLSDTFPLPAGRPDGPMLAEPRTRRYTMIGTAFDYLLRFYIEMSHGLPRRYWIAEIPFCNIRADMDGEPEFYTAGQTSDMTEYPESVAFLEEARRNYRSYRENGTMEDGLVHSAIRLAQIDPLYRAHMSPEHLPIDADDVADLRRLLAVAVDTGYFARGSITTNPNFGMYSQLVGGADADLFMDGLIVDIKTTKTLKLTRPHYNQIVGYYILDMLENKGRGMSEGVGIYYSRHGILHVVKKEEFVDGMTVEFLDWFMRRAMEQFHPDPARQPADR
ncbi:MAG: hypothetical protein MPJ08_02055 [Nitrosopumilus sp.]|nr:hypothetical protein [Nitrosopumilus sp.]